MKLWRTPFDQAEKTTKPLRVVINKDRCKGCGYCVEFCPRESLKMSNELGTKGYGLAKMADSNQCLGCGLCEIICPEFAIKLEPENNVK